MLMKQGSKRNRRSKIEMGIEMSYECSEEEVRDGPKVMGKIRVSVVTQHV